MQEISDDLIKTMSQRLVQHFQPVRIILFGSRAWGAPDPYSDVDLMVIVDDSTLSDYARSVQAHACLSDFSVPKDVIVKTQAEYDFFRDVPASLEHQISRHGKVLYERGQEAVDRELAHESTT